MRSLLAFGCCLLLLAGCAAAPRPTERRASPRELYTVKPNDTLYSIAWRRGLDYREVARWNHLGSDFKIRVGQLLVLSAPAVGAEAPGNAGGAARGAAAGTGHAELPPPGAAPGSSAGVPGDKSAPLLRAPPSPVLSALPWTWPTDHGTTPRAVPSGGILIAGQLGQDIRAAGAGRVVYNGSGIRGYGNLIIIRHGDRALTAYAHNRDSLVHDGEEVLLGQVIAHMGEGAPRKPVLYFEIRLDGKPVDAAAVLANAK